MSKTYVDAVGIIDTQSLRDVFANPNRPRRIRLKVSEKQQHDYKDRNLFIAIKVCFADVMFSGPSSPESVAMMRR